MAEQRESRSADSLPITNVIGLARDGGGERRALRAVMRKACRDDMGVILLYLSNEQWWDAEASCLASEQEVKYISDLARLV